MFFCFLRVPCFDELLHDQLDGPVAGRCPQLRRTQIPPGHRIQVHPTPTPRS